MPQSHVVPEFEKLWRAPDISPDAHPQGVGNLAYTYAQGRSSSRLAMPAISPSQRPLLTPVLTLGGTWPQGQGGKGRTGVGPTWDNLKWAWARNSDLRTLQQGLPGKAVVPPAACAWGTGSQEGPSKLTLSALSPKHHPGLPCLSEGSLRPGCDLVHSQVSASSPSGKGAGLHSGLRPRSRVRIPGARGRPGAQ